MMTAVDTNILIDVSLENPEAVDILERTMSEGKVVICEIVYAEICTGAESAQVDRFLDDLGIELVRSSRRALALGAEIWRRHIAHGGRKAKILPDFLIGAHAIVHAQRLLTRDRGFYRSCFNDLTIIEP